MSINGIVNIIRRECERVLAQRADTRVGIVDSYDPNLYCAKVRLQPEDPDKPEESLTGFLPILTEWVGNGWGIVCPPTKGDVVDVHFQEWGKNAGYISKRFYSSKTLPPTVSGVGCPSGEFWLLHQSGSLLKFHNDGSVEVTANTNMTLTAGSTLRLTAPVIQVHATQEYRFDVNGHGQAWHPTLVNTYQDGESPGAHHAISPPEIGD